MWCEEEAEGRRRAPGGKGSGEGWAPRAGPPRGGNFDILKRVLYQKLRLKSRRGHPPAPGWRSSFPGCSLSVELRVRTRTGAPAVFAYAAARRSSVVEPGPRRIPSAARRTDDGLALIMTDAPALPCFSYGALELVVGQRSMSNAMARWRNVVMPVFCS